MWKCACRCGETTTVRGTLLRAGKVKSCGCLSKKALEKRTKHGYTSHPLYNQWNLMKDRCSNPNNKSYKHYGKRGISVCERWLEFSNFAEDVSPRPKGAQLDRINNEGDYEPDNCKWVSPRENCNNRSSNRAVTFRGKTKTVSEWARSTGIKYRVLLARLDSNWSVPRALTTPTKTYKKTKEYGSPEYKTNHPLYNVWSGMKRRCYIQNDQGYRNYGGRGIRICDAWLDFWTLLRMYSPAQRAINSTVSITMGTTVRRTAIG